MIGLSPGDRIDRFEVVRLLGEGGSASVFEVIHRDLRTRHALKVLHVSRSGLRERLVIEGRIQAHLRHPNLCRVMDVLRVGGLIALVMELVEGPSLDVLLARYRPSLAQVDQLARDILAGVGAAHAAGLVHRDLKPGNVLVDLSGSGGALVVAKVTDFGLAKALDASLCSRQASAGQTMGTPLYSAPEQHRDASQADIRSDIFSLGVLLYELVAGKPPFSGTTPVDLYPQSSRGLYRPLSEVIPRVPARMDEAVRRALRPDPGERWQDCGQLLAAWSGDVPAAGTAWEPMHRALLAVASRAPTPPISERLRSPPAAPTAIPEVAPSVAEEPEPPPPPRPRSRALWALSSAGLLSSVLGCVALAKVALSAARLAPSVPAVAAIERSAVSEARSGSVLAPLPVRVEPREIAPRAAAAALQAPSRPAQQRGARVSVEGFEARLLASDGAAISPGEIPEGRYTLLVFFHPARPTRVLEIEARGDVAVRCNSHFKVCSCTPASRCR